MPDVKKPDRGKKPVLLSGGNPQIAKADGDAPVQAYLAAMPGWKHEAGRRLDALIVRTVPNVRKAVRWNSPFYGVEGQGWFLNMHCLAKYIKVAFLNGASLRPLPPVESKKEGVRYYHIYEGQLDEAQFAAWVKQASEMPPGADTMRLSPAQRTISARPGDLKYRTASGAASHNTTYSRLLTPRASARAAPTSRGNSSGFWISA